MILQSLQSTRAQLRAHAKWGVCRGLNPNKAGISKDTLFAWERTRNKPDLPPHPQEVPAQKKRCLNWSSWRHKQTKPHPQKLSSQNTPHRFPVQIPTTRVVRKPSVLYTPGGKKGKLVQPHWKRVSCNPEESDVPAIPLLVYSLEKRAHGYQEPWKRMFTAAVFLRGKTWNRTKGFLAAERINML